MHCYFSYSEDHKSHDHSQSPIPLLQESGAQTRALRERRVLVSGLWLWRGDEKLGKSLSSREPQRWKENHIDSVKWWVKMAEKIRCILQPLRGESASQCWRPWALVWTEATGSWAITLSKGRAHKVVSSRFSSQSYALNEWTQFEARGGLEECFPEWEAATGDGGMKIKWTMMEVVTGKIKPSKKSYDSGQTSITALQAKVEKLKVVYTRPPTFLQSAHLPPIHKTRSSPLKSLSRRMPS